MINRLRKKFILVTMCSVLAVLIVIVGVINIVNYADVVRSSDRIVSVLCENGGIFGGKFDGDRFPDGDFGMGNGRPMSPETPFETRFFTVVLSEEGEVRLVNVDRIAAIGEKDAVNYATRLSESGKSSGFYGSYRYGTAEVQNGDVMYVFVDCTRELTSCRTVLLVSIAVGLSALVLIFVLVFLLSGKVMKPLADAYYKQKRFITDASHEIKTPLAVIGADAEVLEMQGESSEWTQSIKEQVNRLTSLTEKLVMLAKMDEESQKLKAADFSLTDAVEETVKPFYPLAVSKGLTLCCDAEKGVGYRGDESLIRQLVQLLVDNALKYSDDGGEVRVKLSTCGAKIRFAVSNPAEKLEGDLDALFERFYRPDSSRSSETGGSGIGLSVAKAITDAHKGKITACKEGGTVTFSVTL